MVSSLTLVIGIFFKFETQIKGNKSKKKKNNNKQMGLHQTKGLLYIKEDHQNEKATY